MDYFCSSKVYIWSFSTTFLIHLSRLESFFFSMLCESEQFQRKLPNYIKFYPNTFNYEFQQPHISSQISTRYWPWIPTAITGIVSATFGVQNFSTSQHPAPIKTNQLFLPLALISKNSIFSISIFTDLKTTFLHGKKN